MLFNRESPDHYRDRTDRQVERWRRAFSVRRERLQLQWKAECEWHPWFAWYAVDVGTYDKPQTAWLQRVERRLKNRYEMPDIAASWSLRDFEYRVKGHDV